MSALRKTLHGGVASTLVAARSQFWIPVLEKLTKSTIRNCYGCERFRATHHPNPKLGLLSYQEIELNNRYHLRSQTGTMQAHCITSLKVRKTLKYIFYYFHVVLAELYILISCQILVKKPLRQEQNDLTVLIEISISMIFTVSKGLSGNFTYQGHHGGKHSINVLQELQSKVLLKSIIKLLLTWSELEEVLLDVVINLND